jgi:hypothetical protein
MVAETASAGSAGILVFPNPVRDRISLYFNLKNPGRVRIVITDLMGHRILDEELIRESEGDQFIEFGLGKQVPGFYVLQLFQNDRIIGRESVIIAR